jgi:hypothetical protein
LYYIILYTLSTKIFNLNSNSTELRARVALGDYCFTDCKAYCCRKGYIDLTPKEYELIFKIDKKNKPKEKISAFLGDSCPALSTDFKCNIRNDPLHPKTCKEYPIFIRGKKVILSGNCLAVINNKFYPFISEWLSQDFEIIISNSREGNNLK